MSKTYPVFANGRIQAGYRNKYLEQDTPHWVVGDRVMEVTHWIDTEGPEID